MGHFICNKNKLIISLIGFVHGLTNSGGTLMTIFILNKNKGDKKNSINQIKVFTSFSPFLLFYFF